ncbi:carbonic anhydrase [Novispirillum sp. DQ9]|uniref:carbonic anhydrase n=1 Tax=Novispirillum sp. DQ9 TaxID=3398612 RepID=UPI003C7CDD53
MEGLLEGYRRFRSDRYPEQRGNFRRLAREGQSPHTIVIACCDSRVDPQMIFDAGPGELFVIRNVANLVPPYARNKDYHGTSAALEFGVAVLEVPNILVMGHGRCGGVQALLASEGEDVGDFIGPWMNIADTVRRRHRPAAGGKVDPETLTAAELDVIKVSLANLMTFPFVRDRVKAGTLKLHGCSFDVGLGRLLVLDPDTQNFKPASEDAAA